MSSIISPTGLKGYVHWELTDAKTGRIREQGEGQAEILKWKWLEKLSLGFLKPKLGKRNAIVNNARNQIALSLTGVSITYPNFVGLGTGTNPVTATDTALQTKVQYDGANDAKAATTRSLKGDFTARIVAQFDTDEGNTTIQEIGLFEGNDSTQNMWARINATIVKSSSDRLSIYWYLILERTPGLALKQGIAQQPIFAMVQGSASAATTQNFSPSVTLLRVHNRTGGRLYGRLNGALQAGATPNNYDFLLQDGEDFELFNEEILISSLSLTNANAGGTFTTPDNLLTVSGW
jgi:hypothetical protein